MTEYLVIDGYNLIYEWGKERHLPLKDISLEDFRDKLIERVANYSALMGYETELVFDAWSSENLVSRESLSGINVVFTSKEETADTYIERFLYTRPEYSRTILVTSDARIQDMALLTGAERVSSRQFLKLLSEKEKTHQKYNKNGRKGQIQQLSENLNEEAKDLFERLRRGKK